MTLILLNPWFVAAWIAASWIVLLASDNQIHTRQKR